MKAKITGSGISTNCPGCEGALSNFQVLSEQGRRLKLQRVIQGKTYVNEAFQFVRCPHCEICAVANLLIENNGERIVSEFYPLSIESLSIPSEVPGGIIDEFRESEEDAAIGNYRSASAMLRSTLEKTLKANGYTRELMKSLKRKDNLETRIELAFEDNIITEVRRNRAQQDIRVLGNDVLHDEWRAVNHEEYEIAHQFTQRILEDFYTDRLTVEEILKRKKRINEDSSPISPEVVTLSSENNN